jgi:hypothetical protein
MRHLLLLAVAAIAYQVSHPLLARLKLPPGGDRSALLCSGCCLRACAERAAAPAARTSQELRTTECHPAPDGEGAQDVVTSGGSGR